MTFFYCYSHKISQPAATAATIMSSLSDMDPKGDIKATLTPPASEEADKGDDSGSELSDLDLEPEDSGEILPDHYYDGGKIPVFKPVGSSENCHLSSKLTVTESMLNA